MNGKHKSAIFFVHFHLTLYLCMFFYRLLYNGITNQNSYALKFN